MSNPLFEFWNTALGSEPTSHAGVAPGKVTLTQRMTGRGAVPEARSGFFDERGPAPSSGGGASARATTISDALDPFDFGPTRAGDHAVQAAGAGPAGLDPARVHQAAAHGTSGSGGSLPYLDQIQRAFGKHDVSGIRAHTGERAAEGARAMGAEAFADGEQVAFGGTPSLHTAAHEAAHVIQQRGGVQLKGGVGEAGDHYEQHANAVADLVVQGQSAESVLDRYAGPAGSARGGAIQRLDTNFGKFEASKYDSVGAAGSETGVDIKLTFDPDVKKADAMKIGLTQSVHVTLGGSPAAMYPARKDRQVPAGQTGEGTEIDRYAAGALGNPLYGASSPTGKEKSLGDNPTLGNAQYGWAYKDAKGAPQHQVAWLTDTPTLGNMKNSGQVFETAALAVEGKQAGTYMGSVSWGWSIDGAGKFTKNPLTLVSTGDPSKTFVAAAKQWNSIANFGSVKAVGNPTNVYDSALSVAFTVAKDTDLVLKGPAYAINDVFYNDLTIGSGKEKGKGGLVKVRDMDDVGGPNPVLKLPIP